MSLPSTAMLESEVRLPTTQSQSAQVGTSLRLPSMITPPRSLRRYLSRLHVCQEPPLPSKLLRAQTESPTPSPPALGLPTMVELPRPVIVPAAMTGGMFCDRSTMRYVPIVSLTVDVVPSPVTCPRETMEKIDVPVVCDAVVVQSLVACRRHSRM